ncbi:DNA polymerase III subunit epsilon [Candidatus Phycorickettsia trachydisci]|uniref:DNA polymerase III subunit epsilon n=1 Tax=Candidatus Phycorickettsia trachydisci TaxID=2115978 RepID=A0A2P1P726_9RICK|nr:DNA polymerase III subunit epsilon [Candidatus Phycorickettsia trachydisci]AVP87071.1 DNA polymerase III subunit epsilon [Candidatus Phycorickettsia trachydisci]
MVLEEIVLDTETTGLDPKSGHKIVEIGAIKLKNKIPTGDKFHYYINPLRSMPIEAYNVHGISESFLSDKPTFDIVADEFLDFVKGSTLVIHNAAFDVKFLNHELITIGKGPLCSSIKVVDTLQLARSLYPGKKVSLDALCERFKLDLSNRKLHGALKDAELLAGVYYFMSISSLQQQCTFEMQADFKEIKKMNQKQTSLSAKVIKPTELELQEHLALVRKMQNALWNEYK